MSDTQRAQVLRSMDKYDRIGPVGVFELLTVGRSDSSGDFLNGCGLRPAQAAAIVHFLEIGKGSLIDRRFGLIARLEDAVVDEATGETAFDRVMHRIDPTAQMSGEPLGLALAEALDQIITAERQP